LTGSAAARYAAGMKEQWKQGLQWGAVAWLAWIAVRGAAPAYRCVQYQSGYIDLATCVLHVAVAAGWVVAIALFASGSRWGRAALGATIAGQIVSGTMRAAGYPGEFHVAWALTFWLPMTLPLLPLLFMAPSRPRLTLALALLGRWRDAYATLAGWNWVLVAAGLVALNRAGWDALEMHVWDPGVSVSVVRFEPLRVMSAFAHAAALWGLAAIPTAPKAATA
jgi:hypothetical protein